MVPQKVIVMIKVSRFRSRLAAGALALIVSTGAACAAPQVVASINPLHSLVAGVMQGVGTPKLLVRGGASPHAYALKPSDVLALRNADLIFWTGEDMETFLPKALRARSGTGKAIELFDIDGIQRWKLRAGGAWDAHNHAEHKEHAQKDRDHREDHQVGHKDSSHGIYDMHIWLDPMNAKVMVTAIETALVRADPHNAALYRKNAAGVRKRLDALDAELRRTVSPVKNVPYIVFHDAYQGFENRYGLDAVGSITVRPETKPGAKRLHEIRRKLMGQGAVCVFSEPQFEPALVRTIVRGTNARTGVLDPLGAAITPGKDAYFSLMRKLAKGLKTCLQPSH